MTSELFTKLFQYCLSSRIRKGIDLADDYKLDHSAGLANLSRKIDIQGEPKEITESMSKLDRDELIM